MKIIKSCLLVFYIITVIQFAYFTSNAQSISKHRSVTGISGFSGKVSTGEKSYHLQQSIGQIGINRTFKSDKILIFQGFIHPIYHSRRNFQNSDDLDIDIRTIPSSDTYIISVNELDILQLFVSLFNISGQQIFAEIYNAREFSVNLSSYSSGCYILVIQTFNQKSAIKLLKD